METIINEHLSLMLDDLLHEALEEKPEKYIKQEEYHIFEWDMFRLVKDNRGISISIYIPSLYASKEKDWFRHQYPSELTYYQKEMINKIFQKWSNGNGNKIYANTDNDREFKTRLKVGEVVIIEYDDYRLNYHRNYVSVVKDIVIDKENNVYTCRLDNFNIDFELYHQVPHSINSGGYIDTQNKIHSNIYKIEDFEKYIQVRSGFHHTKKSLLIILDSYKIFIEAMKLKEKLQQGQQ